MRDTVTSGAAAICICLAIILGCAGGSSIDPNRVNAGDAAPTFNLSDLNTNEEFSAGKVFHNTNATVITIWSMACPNCREALADIQKTYETYSGQNITFVGVNFDTENIQGVRAFVKGEGIAFPMLWDRGRRVAKSYKALDYTFSVFVVDREGLVVRAQYDHPPDLAEILAETLDEILE